jgi:hypothetical protein
MTFEAKGQPMPDNNLRAPYIRWALVAAIIWSLRNIAWINLCLLLLARTEKFRQGGAPSILAMFGIANGSALLLWLMLIPRKQRARSACSILFLRGFKQEVRSDVPNRVLPCIGCYGRLMWLPNTVKAVDQDSIGVLTGEDMTDSREQPFLRKEWMLELQKLLAQADLVVVDFSVMSDSLVWEIESCLEQMSAERIILITELSRKARNNYRALCERFPELCHVPSPIPVYPSRFAIPLKFWKWWLFQYERRMHRCMRSIADRSPAPRRKPQPNDGSHPQPWELERGYENRD